MSVSCGSSDSGKVYAIQPHVIKFVSVLWQLWQWQGVCNTTWCDKVCQCLVASLTMHFLWSLQFPPLIKLMATILGTVTNTLCLLYRYFIYLSINSDYRSFFYFSQSHHKASMYGKDKPLINFDYHSECRGGNLKNLYKLRDRIKKQLDNFEFFYVENGDTKR